MPKRITLKDVAQAAGVATGTVSMVLNDNPLVADATKVRVQAVLKQLGYVYDQAAGNLRSKRSRIVGVSICNLVNPYFTDVTAGIQEALEALGRVLVLGNCAESVERQLNFLQTLRQYNVEGVLLTPAIGTPREHISELIGLNVPIVQVTRYVDGVETDYVGNDNRTGAALATEHLVELGHERIAYLGRDRRTSTGRDRYEGFCAAMKSAKLRVAEELVIDVPATRETGFAAAVQAMKVKSPPTALICFNDPIAFGAMLGLKSLGLEPGSDCSVVGMDDVSEAALWSPGLSTVAIGRERIGQVAGRLLMDRLSDPDRPFEQVVIKPELIPRRSSGPRLSPYTPRKLPA